MKPKGGKDGPQGPAQELGELARRGLELGGRTTREIASGGYGAESLSRDLRDWADLQRRYGVALTSLWTGSLWTGSPQPGSPDTASPDTGSPDTGSPDTERPAASPAAAELQWLGERVAELEASRASLTDLQAVADRVPGDAVTTAVLERTIGALEDRLTALGELAAQVRQLEERCATHVGEGQVGQIVAGKLRSLAARRRQLETELMVRDLHRGLLPKASAANTKMAPISARLAKAGSDTESRNRQLETEILELVKKIKPSPKKESWVLLRDQLFKGLLGRSWEHSRDYTGYYDNRLKADGGVRQNLAKVTLSLLESSEYRHRLQTRVDAALNGGS